MFLIFGTLGLFMMTTNLFVIANIKKIANLGSFRILLPLFRTTWDVGVLNSAIFNSFLKSGWVWQDFGGPSEFRVGWRVVWTPKPPHPRYTTASDDFSITMRLLIDAATISFIGCHGPDRTSGWATRYYVTAKDKLVYQAAHHPYAWSCWFCWMFLDVFLLLGE